MGVIESVKSYKNKRNLRGLDGARHEHPRYLRLTKTYKEELVAPRVAQK